MKPTYTEIESEFNQSVIKADFGNGHLLFIPKDESNSDYQAYLRHLAGEDDEGGTL